MIAELPPSVYEGRQKAAPEYLEIDVLRVDVEPGEQPNQQKVIVAALVRTVHRTMSELTPGALITISYTHTKRETGYGGPGEIPILTEAAASVAYLVKSEEGDTYAPVAGVMSFSNF
jgi:hypothetical protein